MVEVNEITESVTWEEFVLNYSRANFLHSWNWGQFHQKLGQPIHRAGFYQGSKLVGVMLSIVEKAKRATYLTVPGGPLIDWSDAEVTTSFRNEIVNQAQQFSCSFVRVRPQILETAKNMALFKNLGFKWAPMHLHAELTHQLDITQSEEKLLADMRKATRYEIKQAQKLGIEVKMGGDIGEFYDLQIETAKRQGFVPFSKKFLMEQFQVFATDNQSILYTACLGKTKLAQAMIIFYGQEADYHYGASSPEGRQYPGAYAIQWEAIKEAKKRGMLRYNLWGVAPEGEKSHRFYGVSVFKRGFGGQDVVGLHARDLVIDWPRYAVDWSIEILRKKMRNV